MNKKEYEKSAADEQLDQKMGYKEGSKEDNAADAKLMAQMNHPAARGVGKHLKVENKEVKASTRDGALAQVHHSVKSKITIRKAK